MSLDGWRVSWMTLEQIAIRTSTRTRTIVIATKRRDDLHRVLRSFLPVAYRVLLARRPELRGRLQAGERP